MKRILEPCQLKSILIFDANKELIRVCRYKTKFIARKQYAIFKKHGHIDMNTGLPIPNVTFELI